MKIDKLLKILLALPLAQATTTSMGSGVKDPVTTTTTTTIQDDLPLVALENNNRNFQHGCSHASGGMASLPRQAEEFQAFEISVSCSQAEHANPQTWVVGTSDANCERDRIENCRIVRGHAVKCDVQIAPFAAACGHPTVAANIHILCCGGAALPQIKERREERSDRRPKTSLKGS